MRGTVLSDADGGVSRTRAGPDSLYDPRNKHGRSAMKLSTDRI